MEKQQWMAILFENTSHKIAIEPEAKRTVVINPVFLFIQ